MIYLLCKTEHSDGQQRPSKFVESSLSLEEVYTSNMQLTPFSLFNKVYSYLCSQIKKKIVNAQITHNVVIHIQKVG